MISYLTEACLEGLGSFEEDERSGQVTSFLTDLFEGPGGIFSFCKAFPKIRFMTNFPVVRGVPYWYPVLRGSILRNMQAICFNSPPNFSLLSEVTAELEQDGKSLSLVWGMAYVKATIDQVEVQLSVPIPEHVDRYNLYFLINIIRHGI